MVGWPCETCVFVDEKRWKDPRIPGWLRPLMQAVFGPRRRRRRR